jgi:nucleoid-associated protein YgaU
VASIIVSTVPVLIAATTYAVLAGVVAARLLSNELHERRRTWALERSLIVDDNRRASVARSREHIEFANEMGSRIRLRDAQLADLRDSLVTAEIDLAKARERMSEERARNEALQADVDAAQSDLESARIDLRRASDALAASESAELHARAQILAWEEAAAEEERRRHERSA